MFKYLLHFKAHEIAHGLRGNRTPTRGTLTTLALCAGENLSKKPSIIERIDSVVTDTTFRNEQGQNLELERSNQVIFNGKLFADVPLSESEYVALD